MAPQGEKNRENNGYRRRGSPRRDSSTRRGRPRTKWFQKEKKMTVLPEEEEDKFA